MKISTFSHKHTVTQAWYSQPEGLLILRSFEGIHIKYWTQLFPKILLNDRLIIHNTQIGKDVQDIHT